MSDKFVITAQKQVRDLTESGQFVPAMEVYFKTTGGDTGHVTIPLTTYNAATVGKALTERIAQIDAVKAL